MSSKVLIVIGMHRSGTSAVTRVLNLLGADISHDLMPATEANQLGFWESQAVVDINNAIFAKFGMSWDSIDLLPSDWPNHPSLHALKHKALSLLESDFSESSLWVLKDPRICRLLPFWLPVLAQMHCQPLFIHCLRSPVEVVNSLAKRDDMPVNKGILLWALHTLESQRVIKDYPYVVLDYANFLHKWQFDIEHIAEHFAIEWPGLLLSSITEIEKFIQPGLRHHHADKETELHTHVLMCWAKQIYEVLLQNEADLTEKVELFYKHLLNDDAGSLKTYSDYTQKIDLINDQSKRIEVLDTELSSIYSSKAWRLACQLRNVKEAVQPAMLKVLPQRTYQQTERFIRGLWGDKSSVESTFVQPLIAPKRFAMSLTEDKPKLPQGTISVIVLSKDGADLLQSFFQAFAENNTYPDYEILLIDHASEDDTKGVVNLFKQSLNIIYLPRDKNYSYAESCNYAVEKAKGDYLLFANNDLLMLDDVLGQMRSKLDEKTGLVGCRAFSPKHDGAHLVQHCGIQFVLDTERSFIRPYNINAQEGGTQYFHVSGYFPAVTAAFVMCGKKDFKKLGGFCQDYFYGFEDVDLCLRLFTKLGKYCYSLNDTHLIHDESFSLKRVASTELTELQKNNQNMFAKRFGYFIRRQYKTDWLQGQGYWTLNQLTICLVYQEGMPRLERWHSLLTQLKALYGWETFLVEQSAWQTFSEPADIIINTTSELVCHNQLLHNPRLIKCAWLEDGVDVDDAWLAHHDVLVTQKGSDNANSYFKPTIELDLSSNDFDLASGFVDNLTEQWAKPISVAIVIPEFQDMQTTKQWNDYALSLASNLYQEHYKVRLVHQPYWQQAQLMCDEVVIVIRNVTEYKPRLDQINIMMIDCQPELIKDSEYEKYDHVFALSASAYTVAKRLCPTTVSLLRDLGSTEHIKQIFEMISKLDHLRSYPDGK